MSSPLPAIGSRADQHDEFLPAEALRTPKGRHDILRHLAAMGNSAPARPATVWVGITTRNGVVLGVDPLRSDEEALVATLEADIAARLEPRPSTSVERLAAPGGFVLRLEAPTPRSAGRPFCVRSGTGREFLVRSGRAVLPMSYDAIVGSEARATPPLVEAHDEWIASFGEKPGLALSVSALPPSTDLDEVPRAWVEVLRHPPGDLARDGGWTWYDGSGDTVTVQGKRVLSGIDDPEKRHLWRRLAVETTLSTRFYTDLESLVWAPTARGSASKLFPDHRGEIGPYCLAETVASVVRLASEIALRASPAPPGWTELAAVATLLGAEGWILAVGRPGRTAVRRDLRSRWVRFPTDRVDSRVHTMSRSEVAAPPGTDPLAYALLHDLYTADPEAMEPEPWSIPCFDEQRRFVAPC